jgi:nicotinate-nucleotide pyrophosphorylase (carboxylating)
LFNYWFFSANIIVLYHNPIVQQRIAMNLDTLIALALEEDLGRTGDITSIATIPATQKLRVTIRAKANGVIAGLNALEKVYAKIDPALSIQFLFQDGDRVENGTTVCEIEGNARSILAGERTALNFLQRMSGIASLSRKFVDAVRGTKAIILDTRKTTPAYRLLEKYAVRMGGAENHRIGLYDMILIKDNHIDAAGGITAAVNAARAYDLPIEVEVKNEAELREALELVVDRIMLDNMSLEQIREAVAITAGYIPLEVSGNVSLETVRAIAETGVDYISVGALTHSAPILDLSMRVVQSERV